MGAAMSRLMKESSVSTDLTAKIGNALSRAFFSFVIHFMLSLLLFTVAPGPIVIILIIWIVPAIQVVAALVIFALRKDVKSAIPWILWPLFWLCLTVATADW